MKRRNTYIVLAVVAIHAAVIALLMRQSQTSQPTEVLVEMPIDVQKAPTQKVVEEKRPALVPDRPVKPEVVANEEKGSGLKAATHSGEQAVVSAQSKQVAAPVGATTVAPIQPQAPAQVVKEPAKAVEVNCSATAHVGSQGGRMQKVKVTRNAQGQVLEARVIGTTGSAKLDSQIEAKVTKKVTFSEKSSQCEGVSIVIGVERPENVAGLY